MKFQKLTTKILVKLQSQGFNILFYNTKVCKLSVTWFPFKTNNIYDYVVDRSISGEISSKKSNIIIIDYAILHMSEEDLYGYVFIGAYN